MSGLTMSARYWMWPDPVAPISITRKRVPASAAKTVSGTPTSPL